MSTLTTLTITHLRGAISPFTLAFEKGTKLTIVYGENGTGKSTICDAFEFLGKGKVGSLEGKGLGSTTSYWAAVGKKSTDISVVLESLTGKCTASLSKSNVVVTPSDKRPKVEVLRRSQILGLIETTPAERYKAISRFIDVSGVEASEKTLKDLIRDTETSRGEAVARVDENERIVRQFWETAGKPSGFSTVSAWARDQVNQDRSQVDQEITAIRRIRDSFQKLKQSGERYEQINRQVLAAQEALSLATQELTSLLTTIANDTSALLGIFEAAQTYFHAHGESESMFGTFK
ncbi:MAG: AAA family ATPase [Bacteroidia bacterium]|nr:AAA family ATPase [Bacteroidia bacterium]